MSKITQNEFLDYFADTYFRFIPEKEWTSGAVINVTRAKNKKDWNAEGYGWFFTVNQFPQQEWTRGLLEEKNLLGFNAFYSDIDFEKGITQKYKKNRMQEIVAEAMEDGKPNPTFIVETQKGMHLYWVLSDQGHLQDLPTYKAILDTICDYYGGDPSAKDTTRVLRVPFSFHHKQQPPFTISLYAASKETYTFDEIAQAFPPRKPITKTRTLERGEFPKDLASKIEELYPRIERPSSIALLTKDGNHIPEGKRNKSLHVAATIYRDAKKPIAEAFNYFTTYHNLENEKGRGLKAMRTTIRSAYEGEYTYGMNHEFVAPHVTDEERKLYATAVRKALKEKKDADEMYFTEYEVQLLKLHPTLHIDRAGQFFEYHNGVYVRQTDQEIEAMVYQHLADDNLSKYATRSKVADKIAALAALVITKPFITDEKPHIINLSNGLYNIETNTLEPHTPDYVSIMQSPVSYDADAKAPRWMQFLDEVTKQDLEQQTLLQQFAGYCLTSETKYEKSLILVGPGGNGKGRYANILRALVGRENTSTINMHTLNERFGLSGLYGKKLNIIDEISGHYFESDNIKQIISGEPMSAEIKNKQERLDFRPTAKILFTVNDLPRLNDTTEGIYRRFIIMAFDQVFREQEDTERNVKVRDADLESKLTSELPGIFNWAVKGLASLRENKGFSITSKNLSQLEAYRRENSPLAEFLDQKYTIENNVSSLLQTVYADYRRYCEENGYKPKTINNVGKELASMGHKKEIIDRKVYISGLTS